MEFQLQTGVDLVRAGVKAYKPAGSRIREGLGEGPRATRKHLKKIKVFITVQHVMFLF